MNENAAAKGGPTAIAGASHVAFAVTMIALGIMGLAKGDFAPVWQPVPKGVPARATLYCLCTFIPLLAGIGLLWPRTVAAAARVLFAWLSVWMLLFRVPNIFRAPASQETWSGCAETAAIVAGAWVLCAWSAVAGAKRGPASANGPLGVRLARLLYGLALLPFGVAHFTYFKETAAMVPGWMPARTAWAAFTGGAFLTAGVAVLIGVWARLAATLAALQLALFTLLVWVPIVVAGPKPFQWSEFVISWTVTAAAWVVADSYRGQHWLAVGQR
jgi:uncharacterized membrane protein